jgi:two-component system, NarL family, response regulator LiaR
MRVALVNDYELVVRGLTALLQPFRDRIVVAELDVGANPRHRVDIALFDAYGHAQGGVDRVRSLANDARVGAVAVYTWSVGREQVDAILEAGARAVLAKSMSAIEIADALVAVHNGSVVVSPSFHRRRAPGWPGREFGLTSRESDVAAFLALGCSNREIAAALFVSEHTVKSHLKSIFRKVGVTSRAQAVARIASDAEFLRV